MNTLPKKTIVLLILAAFSVLVFASSGVLMHTDDMSGSDGCPFSAMGASLCPQNTIATALHHISTYQSVFNVPIGIAFVSMLLALLFVAYSSVSFIRTHRALSPPLRVARSFDSPPPSPKRAITRWLSLFENSPSRF